jgi:hypothetical protein
MPTATFDFGTLDLTATHGPTTRTGSAAFTFGGLSLIGTVGSGAGAVLLDKDGGYVTHLPNAVVTGFSRELSAPGFVSIRLPMDDATTAQATARRWFRIYWRGKARQVARIDRAGVPIQVDGRQWMRFDNLDGALKILDDVPLYPEYGLDRTGASSRTFGWMSRPGRWMGTVDAWTNPVLGDMVLYTEDTGFRQFKPPGLSYPNPYWIAKRSPYHDEPAGSAQYFRHEWTSTTEIQYQILATGDDFLELWLDGEKIISPDMQQGMGWRQAIQVTGTLPDGLHVLAAKVRNSRRKASPMAFILALQQLKKNGDVVTGPAMVTTRSAGWQVSDQKPGFSRADVLRTFWTDANTNGWQATNLIYPAFRRDIDSNGQEWSDNNAGAEFTLDVGTTLLEAQTQFCEEGTGDGTTDPTAQGMDCDVDPETFAWNAYNRKGTDRSGTVFIDRGHMRADPTDEGGSILDGNVDTVFPKFNVIGTQLADGTWTEYVDDASVSAYGRIGTVLSLGSTSSRRRAQRIARGQFRENAQASNSYTVRISSNAGPQPFIDFDEGDTISVQGATGSYVKVRVMAVTPDFSSDGAVPIDLEVVEDLSA